MKYIKCFVAVLFCLILFVNMIITSSAVNTGFSVKPKPKEDADNFISNIGIVFLTEEPTKKAIDNFAVNSEGMIAIAQTKTNVATVCVYSDEGAFQYGYTFHCEGSFYVEWDENNVNIFFVRSDNIITLDSEGALLDIAEVENTKDNNSYVNNVLLKSKYTVGDKEYSIKNNMGPLSLLAFSYSQVVVTDSNGESRIIYDVNSLQFIKTILIIVGVGTFAFVCIFGVIKQLEKEAERQRAAKKTDDRSLS